ncbi:MAG: aryl-sulfate sulfotransferase [Alphaproteobacteria bacterium]|nr:aryl-sulfate sulfotransferase [Alphaproteobacteria bacterium]
MLEKRSITIAGHRTSLALEAEFWSALETIAARDGLSMSQLIGAIDAARAASAPDRPLASAARVYALTHKLNSPDGHTA